MVSTWKQRKPLKRYDRYIIGTSGDHLEKNIFFGRPGHFTPTFIYMVKSLSHFQKKSKKIFFQKSVYIHEE